MNLAASGIGTESIPAGDVVNPRDLDFVIVGGGILGTAVAALAAGAGYGTLVLRMNDKRVPRADTLRNQGWLQSGLFYHMKEFTTEEEYRVVAQMTYFGGRAMLENCGMQPAKERAVLRVLDRSRIEEMERKAKLLRLPQQDFRRLERDEARERLEELFEEDSSYFVCPDCPFDEAGVLEYLRAEAKSKGAVFVQMDRPVTFSKQGDSTVIRWGDNVLESPMTLLAAGAGGVELARQVGWTVPAILRQTPLLVHPGSCGVVASIHVDAERGFSAVRHECHESGPAIVVGTRVRTEPVRFSHPDHRRVTNEDAAAFRKLLHPALERNAPAGRFTAGVEVIPSRETKITSVEPFVVAKGDIVFASPGRATLALRAGEKALGELISQLSKRGRKRFQFLSPTDDSWTDPIHMHYRNSYCFNDAEAE